jgi:hypothetical protein
MPWCLVTDVRFCGSCGAAIAAGTLAYALTRWPGRPPAYRCVECGEDLLGVCQLAYDAAPELLGSTPGPAPTLDGLAPGPTPADPPMVTIGQLLRRNEARAQAIARWKARRSE